MNTVKFENYTLYYEGNVDLLKKHKVHIIGTRRCSPYGGWVSHEIAKHQDCVVALLSDGCSASAIRGSLFSDGCVVVLATPLEMTFPRSCKDLRKLVLEHGGLIVTPFPEGTEVVQNNFAIAHELAVKLSDAVIVTESSEKGGAMISAGLARQYKKELYAVPGNINQPAAAGTNLLIADGATPVLTIEEVF